MIKKAAEVKICANRCAAICGAVICAIWAVAHLCVEITTKDTDKDTNTDGKTMKTKRMIWDTVEAVTPEVDICKNFSRGFLRISPFV